MQLPLISLDGLTTPSAICLWVFLSCHPGHVLHTIHLLVRPSFQPPFSSSWWAALLSFLFVHCSSDDSQLFHHCRVVTLFYSIYKLTCAELITCKHHFKVIAKPVRLSCRAAWSLTVKIMTYLLLESLCFHTVAHKSSFSFLASHRRFILC